MMAYLDPHTKLADAQPRPLLHQGLAAKLTLARMAADGRSREVVRVYKSQAALTLSSGAVPVFLVSLTEETLKPRLDLYAIPKTEPAPESDVSVLLQDAAAGVGTTVLVKVDEANKPRAILASTIAPQP